MSRAPLAATDVTCTACGCLCDDLTVSGGAADVQVSRGCQRGQWWFRHAATSEPPAAALIGEAPAELDVAIRRAATLLVAAKLPLVFGLDALDVNAQREAVALTDALGGCVDAALPPDTADALFPSLGDAGCTWGEVRDRADLIVYWRCDLDLGHWRHRELVLEPALRQRDVRVIHVNHFETTTSDDDFELIHVDEGRDFEAVWQLRMALRGRTPESGRLGQLAEALATARYGVVIHTAEPRLSVPLRALVTDLNARHRFRLVDLGRPGNAVGQSQVTRWQTGYSRAVGLHRGYPLSYGREFAAESLLARGEVDAAVSFGTSADGLTLAAKSHLLAVPHVVFLPGMPLSPPPAQVTLFTATAGVDCGGTVFRSDGLTLPLRPAFSTSFPQPEVVIRRLLAAVRSHPG